MSKLVIWLQEQVGPYTWHRTVKGAMNKTCGSVSVSGPTTTTSAVFKTQFTGKSITNGNKKSPSYFGMRFRSWRLFVLM